MKQAWSSVLILRILGTGGAAGVAPPTAGSEALLLSGLVALGGAMEGMVLIKVASPT